MCDTLIFDFDRGFKIGAMEMTIKLYRIAAIMLAMALTACASQQRASRVTHIESQSETPQSTPTSDASQAHVGPPTREIDEFMTLEAGKYGSIKRGHVLQIIDSTNMLAEIRLRFGDSQVVWISELDTSAFADGSRLYMPFIEMNVHGRKEYESAFGKRTVFVLRPTSPLWRAR
jgi:hypothetical protein